MYRLIKNELIKIFKRKNIYIIIVIGMLVITTFNIYQKWQNRDIDIKEFYERQYARDKMQLENYGIIETEETYEELEERVKLEKYAIENDIKHNILLNLKNDNVEMPKDAQYLLLKVYDYFDIAIILINIYLASTIISEEYNSGTIKNLLVKPHKRTTILISKIITTIAISIVITIFVIILQYILGGAMFGFESYDQETVKYNTMNQNIETMSLTQNIVKMTLSKIPMYLLIILVSLIFGVITNNIALDMLISLGVYYISTTKILINNITKYIFIFNWDLSRDTITNIGQSILISVISIVILLSILIIIFKNKDVKTE